MTITMISALVVFASWNYGAIQDKEASAAETSSEKTFKIKKWEPEQGSEFRYKYELEVIPGDSKMSKQEWSWEEHSKVKEILKDGGFTQEIVIKAAKLIDGGKQKKLPESSTYLYKYKKKSSGDYECTESESKDKRDEEDEGLYFEYSRASVGWWADVLMLFDEPKEPIKVGSKWSFVQKPEMVKDEETGEKTESSGYELDYEVVGIEKIDSVETLKVSVKLRQTNEEKPAKGTATIWVDPKTVNVLKCTGEIEGNVMPILFDKDSDLSALKDFDWESLHGTKLKVKVNLIKPEKDKSSSDK